MEARQREAARKSGRLFLVILGAVTALRIVYSSTFPLVGDEAYYWEWSRHPALGYYDHGPLSAWVTLATTFFGVTLVSIRLGGVLLMAGTTLIVFALARRMFQDERTALRAGLLLLFCPLFMVGALFTIPDSPMAFSWMLCLYFVYRATFEGRRGYWYLAGICLGLCVSSKLIGLLLPAAVFLFLLLSKEKWRWLVRKEPYLALLLAVVTAGPMLYWNSQNDWAAFRYQFSERDHSLAKSIARGEIRTKYAVRFLTSQAAALSPVLFLTGLAAVAAAVRKGFWRRDDRFLFLAAWFITPFGAFLLASLGDKVGAHWAGMGWPSAFVLLAALSVTKRRGKFFRVSYWLSLVTAAMMTATVLILAYVIPRSEAILNFGFRERADGRIQEGIREYAGLYLGWQELGEHVSRLVEGRAGSRRPFVCTYSWSLAPQVEFSMPGKPQVYLLPKGKEERLRGYRYWPETRTDVLRGQDAIFVSKEPIEGKTLNRLNAAFERTEELPALKIYSPGGHHVRSFGLAACHNYLPTTD